MLLFFACTIVPDLGLYSLYCPETGSASILILVSRRLECTFYVPATNFARVSEFNFFYFLFDVSGESSLSNLRWYLEFSASGSNEFCLGSNTPQACRALLSHSI